MLVEIAHVSTIRSIALFHLRNLKEVFLEQSQTEYEKAQDCDDKELVLFQHDKSYCLAVTSSFQEFEIDCVETADEMTACLWPEKVPLLLMVIFSGNAVFNEERSNGAEAVAVSTGGRAPYEVPQPYLFNDKATDENGNMQYHKEQVDARGAVRDSYGYTDIEGLYRRRRVDYSAVSNGFHALTKTNKPGAHGEESPTVQLIAREPAVDIHKSFNELRSTRIDGIVRKPFNIES
ncbi:hypothetical protein AVEN_118591-1 [Araneus ventricosus]|uniref:Cuticle protein 10.9 n=1 Tax=Araneus ventricosus TaxID=182803 RepID=A0A4Y2AXC2_ARAVE|nr:hypothetical protein AVEN_118591-1 [Araneus ventricosus]